MAAKKYKFFVEQGSTFRKTFVWKTKNQAGTFVPVNLTGWQARMQVRTSVTASSTILNLTNGSGITLGGAAGSIEIHLTATQTAALVAGTFVYDLELVSPTGEVDRKLKGAFVVDPEVTR